MRTSLQATSQLNGKQSTGGLPYCDCPLGDVNLNIGLPIPFISAMRIASDPGDKS